MAIATLNRFVNEMARLAEALQQGALGRIPAVVLLDRLWIKVLEPTEEEFTDRTGRRRRRCKLRTFPLLVADGVDPVRGERWVVDWERGIVEDEVSWRRLLERLLSRGLSAEKGLRLFIHDGSTGLEQDFALVHFGPGVERQRCIFHTIRTQLRNRRVIRRCRSRARIAERNDGMNLQCARSDDNTFDQQLQDRLFFLKGHLRQAASDTRAERGEIHPHLLSTRAFLPETRLLFLLCDERRTATSELFAPLGELAQRDHLARVGIEETLLRAPQPLDPRLETLLLGLLRPIAVDRRVTELLKLGEELERDRPEARRRGSRWRSPARWP